MKHSAQDLRPLFILSIPRSGSTLLQTMLASHHDIATVSEPWIFLPLLYALRKEGCYAEYAHKAAAIGVEDFLSAAGLDQRQFVALLGSFVGGLYSSAVKRNAVYFLDKTPRYHLIANDLLASLPDARFIFLWRNPAAVAASMINISPSQRWNLHEYKIDLYQGVTNLTNLYQKYQNDPRVTAVCYEEFVKAPLAEVNRLFSFLGLDARTDAGSPQQVGLAGRLGDPRASDVHGNIDAGSLGKWKSVMANPLRSYWLKRYIRWIGAKRLALMGYNLDELEFDIAEIQYSLSGMSGDMAGLIKGVLSNTMEAGLFRDKWRQPSCSRVPHR